MVSKNVESAIGDDSIVEGQNARQPHLHRHVSILFYPCVSTHDKDEIISTSIPDKSN